MRGITCSRWSGRKRLSAAALLAITVVVVADRAGGLWPFASLPPALVRPADGAPSSVIIGVTYSWRGLMMQRAPATAHRRNDGLLVEQVQPGSPAASIKLKPGDIITALDGITVNTARSLAMAVADHCCGPTVSLSLWRDHHFRHIELPPRAAPSPSIAAGTVERGGMG
jgi:membrane-associated protease RseP (regulator of RpoE activity)